MAREGVTDLARCNIPNPDQFILCTSSKVLPIWAKADASDVQVTGGVSRIVLEDADLLSRDDVENLGRSIATSGNIFPIMAKADAADDTLVLQSVKQVDVKDSWNLRVEDCEPIRLNLFLMLR